MLDSRLLIASIGSVHNKVVFPLNSERPCRARFNATVQHLSVRLTLNRVADKMVLEGWGQDMSDGLCGAGNKHLS